MTSGPRQAGASKATDPAIARPLDTTDGCGADDENGRFLRLPKNFSRVPLRNTLSDQRDCFDLRISQALQGAAVDATELMTISTASSGLEVNNLTSTFSDDCSTVAGRRHLNLDGFDVDLISTPRTKGTISVMCVSGRPFLNIYLQDLFTAARFDASELDGTLLTARAMEDAEKLVRACSVLGTELGGWELIRDPAVGRESEEQGLAVFDDGNGSNGGNTHGGEGIIPATASPSLGETPSSGDVHARVEPPPSKSKSAVHKQAQVVEWHPSSRWRLTIPGVSNPPFVADVARIMPRVVSHRVRMRDGWMDEVLAGAVCGATFFVDKGGVERKPGQDGMEAEIGHGEATVLKDVLVRNLQKV
ncbi:hypothetical protein JOM56_005270 [Amanita muscaria]